MMMLKIFDYFFLVQTLTKKRLQIYKTLLGNLYKLTPFNSKLSQRVHSSVQSKFQIFEEEDEGKENVCAPLEFYVI